MSHDNGNGGGGGNGGGNGGNTGDNGGRLTYQNIGELLRGSEQVCLKNTHFSCSSAA